jgi:hypothetical protein
VGREKEKEKMTKLYEMVGNYRSLLEVADSEDGEAFLAVLDTLSDAIETKVEGCAKVVKSLMADMAVIKAEEDRLAGRRKSVEGNIARLKTYMRENMEGAEKQKIKTPLFTIYIIAGKPKVEIDDETRLSNEYRAEPKPPPPDRKAILVALQAGKEVPGAKLITGDPSLGIR